ncbi:hypothetical protein [Aestuariirhabdus sp. LZHN29]|uniref:hypothetical protein n=1 Tax=Aestuariirhabdus sp. LZHN29 TaxID=3417462 RepID=UPI003CEC167E
MPTHLKLSNDQSYVLVVQTGPLRAEEIYQARAESLPLYQQCEKALVDYRLADISSIPFLEIDTLAAEFRNDVPKCKRMAIVRTQGKDEAHYIHLQKVCVIRGVDTQIFDTLTDAQNWLAKT